MLYRRGSTRSRFQELANNSEIKNSQNKSHTKIPNLQYIFLDMLFTVKIEQSEFTLCT